MHRPTIVIFILFAAVLSACGPSPGEQADPGDSPPQPAPDDPLAFEFVATCTANDLVNYDFCQNDTCAPADWALAVSTTPLLDWEAASCLPNGYKVTVFAFPNVKVFEGLAPFGQSPNILLTALQVNAALAPGGHYSWSVTPILNGQDYWTPNSQTFFTGPICSGFGLLAPDLVSPANNATVSVSSPVMIVSYAPDCNPLYFIREMDTSPSFNGPNLMPGAGGGPFLGQIPAAILQDCSKYYWRAKAGSQGQVSPWSSTFSFDTDFDGNCGGQPAQSESVPEVDNEIFYYGGACTPQDVSVMMMVEVENLFNVVLFYRLEDMETGEKTEWSSSSMNLIGNGYYERVVHSSDIPDADLYTTAYFQVQIVATNSDSNQLLRTEVFPDLASLLACGSSGGNGGPRPTATPRPSPTPRGE